MEEALSDKPSVCVLLRTTSLEEVKEVCELLNAEGIKYRATGTKAGFDIMEVGRAGGPADKLILVMKEDHARACKVVEASYTSSPLPEGHFLVDASDDQVLEILAAPEEWSFFDLAQARKIARERQLSAVDLAEKKVAHVEELREGKPVPPMVLWLGWVLAWVGSGIGVLIGVGIMISTETTPHGSFSTYDKASRDSGGKMAFTSVMMSIALAMVIIFLSRQ